MDSYNWFKVYSFFALGLLLWALSVYLLIGNNTTPTSSTEEFGVQSYEEGADECLEVPENGYWYIVKYKSYDNSCIDTECHKTCLDQGRTTTDCKNSCVNSDCTTYVSQLRGWKTVQEHWTSEVNNSFIHSTGKQEASKDVKEAAINNRDSTYKFNEFGYNYKIWSNRYSMEPKPCLQLACMSYCMGKKGEAWEAFCEQNCVSSMCMEVYDKASWDMAQLSRFRAR